MKFLNKFLYCGQDKGFIKNNRREIYDNNMKIMRGVNVVNIDRFFYKWRAYSWQK